MASISSIDVDKVSATLELSDSSSLYVWIEDIQICCEEYGIVVSDNIKLGTFIHSVRYFEQNSLFTSWAGLIFGTDTECNKDDDYFKMFMTKNMYDINANYGYIYLYNKNNGNYYHDMVITVSSDNFTTVDVTCCI